MVLVQTTILAAGAQDNATDDRDSFAVLQSPVHRGLVQDHATDDCDRMDIDVHHNVAQHGYEMTWPKRPQPYTDTGIRRLRCVRCGERAWSQWQVCADGNNFRAICQMCDVALNRLVLEWMGHPRAKDLGDIYEGATT